MAILSKIRDRSMFLIIIVGLALFSFVLSPSSIKNFFDSSKINSVGKINGDKISRKEFSEMLENYKSQFGSRMSEIQLGNIAWNNLVREKVYKQQLEKAGIAVGESDIWNELIKTPSIKDNPDYQTNGLFDQKKLKEFLSTVKYDNPQTWKLWQNYMSDIKNNLEKTTYNNLISSGLGASLSEAKDQYIFPKININTKYVYIPYKSIPDSTITIEKSEISQYIKKHEKEFKVPASRDIKYVKFAINPTEQDKTEIKNKVAKLLDNREEYSAVTKGNITIQGLRNAKDMGDFFIENNSDIALDSTFKFKKQIAKTIADKVFDGKKGDVFGPYKENGFFKISKITAMTQMPDSVKASHILIPFLGSRSADKNTKQTEEQAKKTADSILNLIKKQPSDFFKLAKKFSSDKSNADKGGDLDWFGYNRMVPEFRDYCFENKKGNMGVIKSIFGFHVIKIDDQKNIQKAIRLATFARKIQASEATENAVFEKSGAFLLGLSNGKQYDELTKEGKLTSHPAVGLKVLDENIPGLSKEREIVTWAFNKDTKVNDFKRFDVEGGYVVAVLTIKIKEGLMPVVEATKNVRPILIKQKKAKMISEKMNGDTLEAIARENKTSVEQAYRLNLNSPIISGVGSEPKVIGAMINAKKDKVYSRVIGDKGVFAFAVMEKKLPVALPNYNLQRNKIANKRKSESNNIYQALKKSADIEDNRATYYGVNN